MADFVEPRHPWPVIVTSKDDRAGHVYLVTECSADEYKLYHVVMDDTGEAWDVPAKDCRFRDNWTLGRGREKCNAQDVDRQSDSKK